MNIKGSLEGASRCPPSFRPICLRGFPTPKGCSSCFVCSCWAPGHHSESSLPLLSCGTNKWEVSGAHFLIYEEEYVIPRVTTGPFWAANEIHALSYWRPTMCRNTLTNRTVVQTGQIVISFFLWSIFCHCLETAKVGDVSSWNSW